MAAPRISPKLVFLPLLLFGSAAQAANPSGDVTADPDGTVHAAQVSAPVSGFLSPQAAALLAERLSHTPPPPVTSANIMAAREATDRVARLTLAKWQALAGATVTPATIGGVQTDIVMPVSGIAPRNARRILINLHGGGFFAGARSGGQVEAVPLATKGRIKVVTVDYRLAPEAHFPAASQDVAAVYRALLKTYAPQNIGIYGCSAGGTLVAQSVAWLRAHKLPRPGAIGVFCSGAMPSFWYGGDAFAFTPMLNGRRQITPEDFKDAAGDLYLAGTNQNDPLVTPGLFPRTLAQFPPTMILTSTRDGAMSNALVTNQRLLAAGVETQLLVLEGLGHGEFNLMPGTPEADLAFSQIWHFFDRHLGR